MKKLSVRLALLFTLIGFSNCDKNDLNNRDAQDLIVSNLGLPIGFGDGIYDIYNTYGTGPNFHGYVPGKKIEAFKQDGLITCSEINDQNSGNLYLNITILDKGKPYFMGKDNNGCNKFYTYDIEFNQIDGISYNKENSTATVRFSLKMTNVTPFANSLRRINDLNITDGPISGELVFKKFDTGWQIENGNNRTSKELLDQIVGKYYGSYFTYNPTNKVVQASAENSTQQPDEGEVGGDTDAPIPDNIGNPIEDNSSASTADSRSGIYPHGSQRLLTPTDLVGLSKSDLKIMRNEIFARHGYIFKSADLNSYFNNQNWYKPMHADVNFMLTEIERKNIELIKSKE